MTRTKSGRGAWLLGATALALTAVVPAASAAEQGTAQTRVIGGHDAAEPYPFSAALEQSGQFNCGAVLVDPQWVVTAGHCAQDVAPGDLHLRVGSADRTAGGEEAGVDRIAVHPGYAPDQGRKDNDIALLRLDHPVAQQPIRIAATAGPAETPTRILGWGKTCEHGPGCAQPPTRLQELSTKLVSKDDCARAEGGFNGATELCSDSDVPDAQGCQGDSGGPQIKGRPGEWELVGTTSRDGDTDPQCATGPAVYTDVPAHADWIHRTIAA